jgi:hypothetical protein
MLPCDKALIVRLEYHVTPLSDENLIVGDVDVIVILLAVDEKLPNASSSPTANSVWTPVSVVLCGGEMNAFTAAPAVKLIDITFDMCAQFTVISACPACVDVIRAFARPSVPVTASAFALTSTG